MWLTSSINKSPAGELSVSLCRQYQQFYKNEKGYFAGGNRIPAKRSYISTKDKATIKALAQKVYFTKMADEAQAQLEEIEKFLSNYNDQLFRNTILQCPDNIRGFIEPSMMTDPDYLEQWLAEWPESPNSYQIKSNSYTKKGEHVRSKSEKIIGDRLCDRGIPYKYECGIRLACSGIVRYPDFTCLNQRERKVIIWEHLGSDEDKYLLKNMKKLVEYQNDGFIIGDNLILTFENDEFPLDSRLLDKLIDEFLL